MQRAAVLTAARGTWTGNNTVYSYQWQRDGVDIADATGAGYTLTVDDVGKRVRVVVTATNPDATVTAASAPTVVVPSAPPVNTAPPTVSGTAQRGFTLTGTGGVWDGIGNSVKYQWQSSVDGTNWTAITSATSSTRVISTSEIGRFMRLLVTVTNAEGVVSEASAATAKVVSSPPVNSVRPVISGTAQRGQTLVGTLGTWTGVDNVYDHQWQRSVNGTTWTNIAGATRPSYDLTVADVGSIVRLLVTATNPDGTLAASSTASATVPSALPVNTGRPTVTGTARRGVVLSGTSGTWSGIGNAWAYQWQRSSDNGTTWQSIAGADQTTYALANADVGAIVRLRVTASNPEGSATETSLATAVVVSDGPANTIAPAISGVARRASTLTAVAGTWSGVGNGYTFQWQRSTDGTTWSNIGGATSASFEPTTAEVGATLRVLVTATNPDGVGSRASAATATVQASPPANAGLPTVTGAALRATTLNANAGTWTGPGNTYSYRWQRDTGSGFVGHHRGGHARLQAHRRGRRRPCAPARHRDQPGRDRQRRQPRHRRRAGRPARVRRRPDHLRHGAPRRAAVLAPGRVDRDRERLRLPVAARHGLRLHEHRRRDRDHLPARVGRRGREGAPEGHRDQRRRHRHGVQRRDRHRRRRRADQPRGPDASPVRRASSPR